MTIAIPLLDGRLSSHFGHCSEVALIDADRASGVLTKRIIPAPPHEPGRFPAWLREQGADMVIAGGMGQRALQLFTASGIQVILGASCAPAEVVVQAWLEGRLKSSGNTCRHDPGEPHACRHALTSGPKGPGKI